MPDWYGSLVFPDAPITPDAVRAGVRSLTGKLKPRPNPGMFAAVPQQGGSISVAHPRLADRISDGIASALRTIGLPRYSANMMGSRTSGFLNDFTPLGAATSAEDAKAAWHQGRYPAALGNALLAGISALPDGGALAGKVSHSIIAPLFHGSPHKFEKFALDKIGTGEGAQAYGHGLYFAENPATAKAYQQNLSGTRITLGDKPFDVGWHVRSQMSDPNEIAAEAIDRFKGDVNTAVGWLSGNEATPLDKQAAKLLTKYQRQNAIKVEANPGHLYEVKLDANPEDFLNWDAPLSEQSHHLSKLRSLSDVGDFGEQLQPFELGSTSGQSVYSGLNRNLGDSSPAATAALREAGIPGLRYLDQGSRGAGNGTHNYVVFDPSLIDITNRF